MNKSGMLIPLLLSKIHYVYFKIITQKIIIFTPLLLSACTAAFTPSWTTEQRTKITNIAIERPTF
jgi:hypothetical protein